MSGPLRVLLVDDERPALDELAWLLGRDDRVGEVLTATSGAAALRLLGEAGHGGEDGRDPAPAPDALFLDVEMPGLSGLDLAAVLARFREPPPVVFVTAHTEHAVEAFDLHAVDYLLKPVREERLREAVRRVQAAGSPTPAGPRTSAPSAATPGVTPPGAPDETIAVELGGVTRFLQRSEVRYVEAQGDYARLHTGAESHLVRVSLTSLEERWADVGFTRVHRSLLVALEHVEEVRVEAGRCTVLVAGRELAVSRRHTGALRERLRQHRVNAPVSER